MIHFKVYIISINGNNPIPNFKIVKSPSKKISTTVEANGFGLRGP